MSYDETMSEREQNKPFRDLMECIEQGQLGPVDLRRAADAIWEAAKRTHDFSLERIMKLVASGLHTEAMKREQRILAEVEAAPRTETPKLKVPPAPPVDLHGGFIGEDGKHHKTNRIE